MPITESPGAVPVTAGAGATAADLSRLALGDRVLVIRDAALDPVGIAFPRGVIDLPVDLSETRVDAALVESFVSAGRGATAVIGFGGGTILDAAKITRMLLAASRLAGPLRVLAERSGIVRVPELVSARASRIPLIAIPTTFGTGSEANRVACLETPHGRRLLSGARLAADHAILDPLHTATLSRELQREGLVEVILRVIGSAVGSTPALAADHDARAIVTGAARLAEQLRVGFLSPEQRLFAAQLSAASHRGWALAGRDAYAAKHWYLANELSWVAGARKIPATLAILPALWRRIAAEESEWGSSDRLAEAWSWLREVVPELPAAADRGLSALISRWRLRPIPSPGEAQLDEVVERVLVSWGAPLPALGRVGRAAVAQIFAESFEARAKSTTNEREGVLVQ